MRNILIRTAIVMLSILSMTVSVMADNNQTNDTNATATPTLTATVTVTQVQPTQTAQVPTTVATTVSVKKFRVGPTVKIRPLNDEINKSTDGLIELYMDNPSLNDIELNVDARISVPSGIHVYGQGFGEAGAAGTVFGTFNVPPGKARTIYITIKAEKVGDFYAQFSGLYYPGDNKDDYQPISLTHPFKVTAPSAEPNVPEKPVEKKIPGISAGIVIFVIGIMAYILRRDR